MPFRNIQPLQVLWQAGIKEDDLEGVFSGIKEVLWLADVAWEFEFEIEYLGQRRDPDWLNYNKTSIRPYKSLDWHIGFARKNSLEAGRLNSARLAASLWDNPTFEKEPRYELVVVKEPLHWHDEDAAIVYGIGYPGKNAVITLNHLLLQPKVGESGEEKKKNRLDFLLSSHMLALHELGHVFGLFPKAGLTHEENLKNHCQNDCIMSLQDSVEFERKIKNQPFCQECLVKLKQFFIGK